MLQGNLQGNFGLRMTKRRSKITNVEELRDPRSGKRLGWRARVRVDKQTKRGRLRETRERAVDDVAGLLAMRERDDDDEPDPTLQQAVDRVTKSLSLRDRRPATALWYAEKFKGWLAEFGGDRKLPRGPRSRLRPLRVGT